MTPTWFLTRAILAAVITYSAGFLAAATPPRMRGARFVILALVAMVAGTIALVSALGFVITFAKRLWNS